MKQIYLFVLMLCVIQVPRISAEEYKSAPEKVQVALFVRILHFDKNISEEGKISIHVVSAPEFAGELKKKIGEKIKNATLSAVNESSGLPEQKPSAIYIGDASKFDEAVRYTRDHKILSMTGIPDLVPRGISLGIGLSGGKPKILLNLSSSKDEGIDWNHAILKVSTLFK